MDKKPKVTFKKREQGGVFVLVDGVEIGHVRPAESCKTGFRRGRCVGQVTVNVWRAFAPAKVGTHEEGHPRNAPPRFGTPGGFGTRAKAVAALIEWRRLPAPDAEAPSHG